MSGPEFDRLSLTAGVVGLEAGFCENALHLGLDGRVLVRLEVEVPSEGEVEPGDDRSATITVLGEAFECVAISDFPLDGGRSTPAIAAMLLDQALLGGLRFIQAESWVHLHPRLGPLNPRGRPTTPWPRAAPRAVPSRPADPPVLWSETAAPLPATVVDLLPVQLGVAVAGAEPDARFERGARRLAEILSDLGALEEIESVGSAWLVESADGWRYVELRYWDVFSREEFRVIVAGRHGVRNVRFRVLEPEPSRAVGWLRGHDQCSEGRFPELFRGVGGAPSRAALFAEIDLVGTGGRWPSERSE